MAEFKSDTRDRIKGFTLIEILIALLIFSLVVTMVFSSFRELAFSARIIDQGSDDYEMLNNCLARIRADLESVFVAEKMIYKEPEFTDDPDPFRFEGGMETINNSVYPLIRFTSRAHLGIDRDLRKGIAEIVYYTEVTGEGEVVLRRADRLNFEKDFEKKSMYPLLCRNVKKMKVKYYDHDGEESDEWDSESEEYGYATPSQISVFIETGSEERSVLYGTRITIPGVRKENEK